MIVNKWNGHDRDEMDWVMRRKMERRFTAYRRGHEMVKGKSYGYAMRFLFSGCLRKQDDYPHASAVPTFRFSRVDQGNITPQDVIMPRLKER